MIFQNLVFVIAAFMTLYVFLRALLKDLARCCCGCRSVTSAGINSAAMISLSSKLRKK